MKEFFDTSVLVAAFWRGHTDHASSLKRVSAARAQTSSCSLHTLAEVYAAMTALPVKEVIPPEQAWLFVQGVRDRFTAVSPDEDEYYGAIAQAAERGSTGGRIYDALLLRGAAKIEAGAIYRWNLKHFRAIHPKLADEIRTP